MPYDCQESEDNFGSGATAERSLNLASFSTRELEVELDRRRKKPIHRIPAGRCQRCGSVWYFVGVFSAPSFERQAKAFADQHNDCPLSIDGGGI